MKRFANDYAGGSSEKRAKHHVEDPWGDSDPDIDNFLLQASQIVDKFPPVDDLINRQDDNESILTYNAFNKNSMLASTQLEASIWAQPAQPSSSSRLTGFSSTTNKRKPLENINYEEYQELKSQVLSKEGEISILRTQLKQTREQIEHNTSKQINETAEKLHLIQKEKERISTELDFKNLEIVNLRRKLEKLTKHLFEATALNQTATNNVKVAELNKCENLMIDLSWEEVVEPILGTRFPLKSVIPLKIFETSDNNKFPKMFDSKHTPDERYLHSLFTSDYHGQQEKGVYTYIKFGETLKMEHFFESIRFLRDASEWELENDTGAVSQIYLLTLTLLTNHLEYLTKFAKLVQDNEIRECEKQNLTMEIFGLNISLLEPKNCDKNIEECAMQCRLCIALLAVVYPHNKYLRNFIANNKLPQIPECERKSWPFAFNNILGTGSEQNLLKILCSIVNLIKQTQRGTLYTGLLCSICCLLKEIVQFHHENDRLFVQIGKLLTEIVQTSPNYPVLHHMSDLFRHGSTCTPFIEQLCRNPTVNIPKKPQKDAVLLTDNCCIIDRYFTLCRQAFSSNWWTHNNDFRVHSNLVHFVTNSINSNVRWMHFEPDKRHFQCQKEYYKLVIEVLCACLCKYRRSKCLNEEIPVEVVTIVKSSPKIFDTLLRKYGELLECNLQYNGMMKTSRALLKDSQGKFTQWNQFEVETIAKQTSSDASSPTATNFWDATASDLLKFELENMNLNG